MNACTVSRLADDAGVSVHVVRDYIVRGLLRPVARTAGGYGLFDAEVLHAVNVSASQVGPEFDAQLKRVLADTNLPAERLEIELTESVAFGDPPLFVTFDALRAIGVRFAADDFGTGYSCLQHLKCCPITTLEIDQSFVAGIVNDARDQTIVRAVIQLAHVT